MQFDALLSTIILVTFLITVIMAVGSYVAYKLRERRRPKKLATPPESFVFFEQIRAEDIARLADGREY